ncbi:MAG TPA: low molecular weight phosphatase family protein [Polyangiaceae bacterium]|jgi:protein-tyrosine phosphatase
MRAAEPKRVLFLCSGNYYRSRFAEVLFNHLAIAEGLPYRADSAGLWRDCHAHNVGPMSPHTIAGLGDRGIPLPSVLRAPRDVQKSDFSGASVVIAVKETEHRPLLESRFPDFAGKVEFWQVDDVGDAPPSVALPLIEKNVRALIQRLARGNAAAAL